MFRGRGTFFSFFFASVGYVVIFVSEILLFIFGLFVFWGFFGIGCFFLRFGFFRWVFFGEFRFWRVFYRCF